MSALPPKADIRQRIENVCFVPKADISEADICKSKAAGFGVQADAALTSGLVSSRRIARLDMNEVWN